MRRLYFLSPFTASKTRGPFIYLFFIYFFPKRETQSRLIPLPFFQIFIVSLWTDKWMVLSLPEVCLIPASDPYWASWPRRFLFSALRFLSWKMGTLLGGG